MMSTPSSTNEAALSPAEPGSSPSESMADPVAGPVPGAWRQCWTTVLMSLRQNQILGWIYGLLLLISLPGFFLLMKDDRSFLDDNLPSLFTNLMSFLVLPVTLLVVITSAGLMFSYLHSRSALDVYHALPIRRMPLFIGRFLTGALLVLLPQLLMMAAVLPFTRLANFFLLDASLILESVLFLMVLSLALYSVSALAFLLSGKVFDAVLFILLINLILPFAIGVIASFASQTLPGAEYAFTGNYFIWLPLGQFADLIGQSGGSPGSLWWLALSAGTIALNLLVYRRRGSEIAGRPFAFRLPFQILSGLACTITALFAGYYASRSGSSLPGFILGAFVASLLTHLILEMILSHGLFQIKRSLISYGIFALVFTVACLIVSTGGFGFDRRLPQIERVDSVTFTSSMLDQFIFADGSSVKPTFREPASLTVLRDIQQAWQQEQQALTGRPYGLNTYQLTNMMGPDFGRLDWRLNSGWPMIRVFYYDAAAEPYARLLDKLKNTPEYRLQRYADFLRLDTRLCDLVMSDKTGSEIFKVNGDTGKEVMKKIQAALRADLLDPATGSDTSADRAKILGNMNVYLYQSAYRGAWSTSVRLQLTSRFTRTINILTECQLLGKLADIADKYQSAYIGLQPLDFQVVNQMMQVRDYLNGQIYPLYHPRATNDAPLLNDEKAFIRIDDLKLVQDLYAAGQEIWPQGGEGYMLLLATEGQVQSDGRVNVLLPVLYLPHDRVPAEVAALIAARP